MREIMISIQPQFVEKILNSEKTIEIRKTMPKCELPCKVYIYCTQGKRKLVEVLRKGEIKWFGKDENDRYEENTFITIPHYNYGDKRHDMLGKVVAEFTLNKITTHLHNFIDCEDEESYNFLVEDVKKAGFNTEIDDLLDFDKFVEEYGEGKPLYAWHIEDLKIYDKPKVLNEFVLPNKKNCKTCFFYKDMCENVCEEIKEHLFRPPQSWCYVEKVGK